MAASEDLAFLRHNNTQTELSATETHMETVPSGAVMLNQVTNSQQANQLSLVSEIGANSRNIMDRYH